MGRDEHWPNEINNLTACENQLVKGLRVYDQLKSDPKEYQDITDAFVEAGRDHYPNDSFRQFLDGQHTRLRNTLKNPHSETEMQVMEARDENVKAMRKLYKQLQIELLPPPNRALGDLEKYLDIRESMTQKSQPDKQISPNKGDDRGR